MIELHHSVAILPTTLGNQILSDCFYTTEKAVKPLVIFCHGYKGFKDWGAWEMALKTIASEGFVCVKFNFSLNGTSLDQPTEFVDLDAFGRNTYSQEQKDLSQVIDYYSLKSFVDPNQIFIIGHSRGGGAVILQGAYNEKVKGVVSWAGVCDYKKRFPKGERFKAWQERGVFYVENARTKQELPHFFSFWEDFVANEKQLDIQYAAQHLKKPTLIIHGTTDPSIDVKEAHLLHEWIKGSSLKLIPNGDHVFGAKHPYNETELPKDLKEVVCLTIEFLKENSR